MVLVSQLFSFLFFYPPCLTLWFLVLSLSLFLSNISKLRLVFWGRNVFLPLKRLIQLTLDATYSELKDWMPLKRKKEVVDEKQRDKKFKLAVLLVVSVKKSVGIDYLRVVFFPSFVNFGLAPKTIRSFIWVFFFIFAAGSVLFYFFTPWSMPMSPSITNY